MQVTSIAITWVPYVKLVLTLSPHHKETPMSKIFDKGSPYVLGLEIEDLTRLPPASAF